MTDPDARPAKSPGTDLAARLDAIFAARDRADMAPTIAAFSAVLAEHPRDPRVLYEVGGAYDTAGEEERAVPFYEQALELGLSGELRRRCLCQYASTLRNLGRLDESLASFNTALTEFPDSPFLSVFKALTLHAAGRVNEGFGLLLTVIADLDDPLLTRYAASIRANGEFVASLPDHT